MTTEGFRINDVIIPRYIRHVAQQVRERERVEIMLGV